MLPLKRPLYRLVLRLHPASFRNRFALEMALDFEDAHATYGFTRLLLDAIHSLSRQWTAYVVSSGAEPTGTCTRPLLAGHYAQIQDTPMRPLELVRGFLASAGLVVLCGFGLNPNAGPFFPFPSVVYASSRAHQLSSAAAVPAQILHATGSLPSFEVATIRPYNLVPAAPPPPPPVDGAIGSRPALRPIVALDRAGAQITDRIHMIATAQQVIAFAFNLPLGFEGRIQGGPDWVRDGSNRYEIQAKIDNSVFTAMHKLPPSEQQDQVELMEQSLLADRFKLKIHFETRELSAYALVVAKGGPKLTPSIDGEISRISMQGNTMTATAIRVDQWILAPFLGGRTIVDRTGLSGVYDITLTWSDMPVEATQRGDSDAPPLFTAVQQQLGLRLIPIKAPVEVIVIDHIERPSEN